MVLLHSYGGEEELGSRRLNQLGLPPFDLFVGRDSHREIGYVPDGDAARVLGTLRAESEVL